MEEVFNAALTFLLRFWVNRNKVELMNEVNKPKMKVDFIQKLKNKVKFYTIVIISCWLSQFIFDNDNTSNCYSGIYKTWET